MKKNIKALLLVLTLFTLNRCFAQQNIERGDYFGEKEISASSSVILKPGFWVGNGSDLRVFIQDQSPSGCTPLVVNSSGMYNSMTEYITLIPGIKSVNDLSTKTICEVKARVQYIDGFNRPLQTVFPYASINQKDIILANEYDWLGKSNKSFLPFEAPVAGGGFINNALAPGSGVYQFYNQGVTGSVPNNVPYSQGYSDGSPNGTIVEQGFPGETWKIGSENTIRKSYAFNNSLAFSPFDLEGSKRVALYSVSSLNETCLLSRKNGNEIYPESELNIAITKNENWKEGDGCLGTIEEYFDKVGKLILKRTYNRKNVNEIEMLSTYYVYDQYGNLSFVLPPNFEADADNAITQEKLNNLTFQYIYDYRGRVVEKKTPSKGREYFVYNVLNQLVLKQDALQRNRSPQEWTFIKYDEYSREVLGGIFEDAGSSIDASISPDNIRRKEMQRLANLQGDLFERRDNNQSLGYTRTTFPNTNLTSVLKVNYYDDYNIPGMPQNFNLSSSYSSNIYGLPTATRTAVLESPNNFLWTVSYYDNRGRNLKTINQHYKGGVISDGNYNDYTSVINFQGQTVNSSARHFVNNIQQIKLDNIFEYNNTGLLEQTKQRINEGNWIILSRRSYNPLNQLISKKIYSENSGASFLQEIKYDYNERGWLRHAMADLFKFQLDYQNPTTNGTPQFNGNISAQRWGIENVNESEVTYKYDKLDRLSGAEGAGMTENNIQYDKVGNISALTRDQNAIAYKYDVNNKNRLLNVFGSALNNAEYQYDLNGNVTYDGSKNNINIKYNLLNKPAQISGSTSIEYKYDANGSMLSKSSNATGLTEYIDFVQYGNVNNVYSIAAVKTDEGRLQRLSDGSYHYVFDIPDYLGNIRVSFDKDPNNGLARRIQSDDYYAFGKRRSLSPVSLDNEYLYNGKEIQEELGEYDYGARFYNPLIGRWNAPDPLSENYATTSSYAYVLNNPIYWNDPDGMQVNPWVQPIGGTQRQAVWIPWGAAIPEGYMMLDGGDFHDFAGAELAEVSVTAKRPEWVDKRNEAYEKEYSIAQDTYRKRTGGLFQGYPKNVINQLAAESFYNKYYKTNEIDPFTGRQRVIPLVDANWIIDIAVTGGWGLLRSGGAPLLAEEVLANGADDAIALTAKTGWKVGQPITNLTAKGTLPAWSTVRQRVWKNEAFVNGSTYSESNLLRMQKGLAPQRLNPNTGLMESMELHHHMVPQRNGGLFDFMKVWPDEHRALDPFRR